MNNKAFTLIELLLVSGIVSLLASVIMFNVSEGKSKAEDGRMKVESSQIISAIEMYKSDNNGFTPLKVTSSSNTGKLFSEDKAEYKAAMQALVSSGYIPSIPRSPDGKSYTYGENSDGTSAIFIAKLKNNSSTKTKDSCGIIDTSDVTYSGCQLYYTPYIPPQTNPPSSMAYWLPTGSIRCPVGFTNCTDYMNANPGKFCFDGYKTEFCSLYDEQASDFCSTFTEYYLAPGTCEAVICNVPTEQPLCSGGNTNDYCSCI